jgi:hypothetical protein
VAQDVGPEFKPQYQKKKKSQMQFLSQCFSTDIRINYFVEGLMLNLKKLLPGRGGEMTQTIYAHVNK